MLDPVVHVGYTTLSLEDPGPLQLDLLGSEALEQTASLTEEHRNDVELELVEDGGGERETSDPCAVDEHVLVAQESANASSRCATSLSIRPRSPYFSAVGSARSFRLLSSVTMPRCLGNVEFASCGS